MICGEILSISLTWAESSRWSLRVAEWAVRQRRAGLWSCRTFLRHEFLGKQVTSKERDSLPPCQLSVQGSLTALGRAFGELILWEDFAHDRWGHTLPWDSEEWLLGMGASLAMHLTVTLSQELSGQEILLSLFGQNKWTSCSASYRKGMDNPIKWPLWELCFHASLFSGSIQYCFFDHEWIFPNQSEVKLQGI